MKIGDWGSGQKWCSVLIVNRQSSIVNRQSSTPSLPLDLDSVALQFSVKIGTLDIERFGGPGHVAAVAFERGEDVAALEVVAGVSERSAGGRRRGELGLADLGGQIFP